MSSQPKNCNGLLFITVAVLALAAMALWLERGSAPRAAPPQVVVAPAQPVVNAAVTNLASGTSTAIVEVKTRGPAKADIDWLRERFKGLQAKDAGVSRRLLGELRATFSGMPRDAAVAAIRGYLDSKADGPTHLGFKVAGNGFLDDAPTIRTFLLDELGRLDAAAAADYSQVILAGKDSPDEWAVALRNLAVGDATDAGRSLLAEKTGEMLQYSPWQQNPSVGYLEAFDAAVYLGGTNLMPTLASLVKQPDNPAVAHAAYLALDRLVINNPAATLAELEAAPDLMQGREATRANYFARADVRDPQQRQVLENYLLNPQISAAELGTFAGLYPSANFMISANLLTPTPTPDRNALVSRDAESLRVAQAWMSDPRFGNVQAALTQITGRLQQFAQQAAAGR